MKNDEDTTQDNKWKIECTIILTFINNIINIINMNIYIYINMRYILWLKRLLIRIKHTILLQLHQGELWPFPPVTPLSGSWVIWVNQLSNAICVVVWSTIIDGVHCSWSICACTSYDCYGLRRRFNVHKVFFIHVSLFFLILTKYD